MFEVNCWYCDARLERNQIMSAYFCNIRCKAEWQKRHNKPVTEEWLREAYLVKKMDCVQIAKIVQRDSKSVWNWMKAFGIPTRPRGCNVGQLPKDGSPFLGKKHTAETKERFRQLRLADGRIPSLINGVHWMKALNRKPGSWRGGITPERQAFYTTPEWKIAVKTVWKRENAICQRCQLDSRTVLRGIIRFVLHHMDGFAIVERRADPGNLMLLCEPCHKWVHSNRNKTKLYLGEGHSFAQAVANLKAAHHKTGRLYEIPEEAAV